MLGLREDHTELVLRNVRDKTRIIIISYIIKKLVFTLANKSEVNTGLQKDL